MANRVAIFFIVAYQKSLSRLLGPRCRFYPSCSQYARLCFEQLPPLPALRKTLGRLTRCHPFHPGGLDYP